jgi:dihydropteroate synthase
MNTQSFDAWLQDADRRPLVMGILNVTPDSFSDGGRYGSHDAAVARARELAAAGADLIDIGGESTRPGALPVAPEEQIRRVVPVLERLRGELPVLFSIDTQSAAVAEACLDAGAQVVNDVSAGRRDPALLPLVAERGVAVVLMHMLGDPGSMQQAPVYENVTQTVAAFLHERTEAAVGEGIHLHRILLDPGIGFGKTAEHNLQLLREMDRLAALGRPLVLGTSRKKFIGTITGEPEPSRRQFGSAATIAWSIANGAAIVRVHDVGPMRQVVRMTRAILSGDASPP